MDDNGPVACKVWLLIEMIIKPDVMSGVLRRTSWSSLCMDFYGDRTRVWTLCRIQ